MDESYPNHDLNPLSVANPVMELTVEGVEPSPTSVWNPKEEGRSVACRAPAFGN